MRHITLNIEGEYWDYLVKYNELILWTYDGKVEIYDWERFINDIAQRMKNFMIYALLQGKYKDKISSLGFLEKFNIQDRLIENLEISILKKELNPYLLREYDIPFHNLAISIDSYNNDLYINTEDGLYTMNRSYLTNKQKLWDNPLYDMKVGKHGRLAMSAGDDGVFEYSLPSKQLTFINPKNEIDRNIHSLSKKHSNTVGWIENDIYSTSTLEEAFLVPSSNNYKKFYTFDSVIEESNIFKSYKRKTHEISWTSQNKLYRVYDYNKLEIVNYDVEDNQKINFYSNFIKFMAWKGNIIAGSSTKFGTIVECENALVLLFDNNKFLNIPGDIIRWKTYDRYHRYSNILGIIFEDKIVFKAFI